MPIRLLLVEDQPTILDKQRRLLEALPRARDRRQRRATARTALELARDAAARRGAARPRPARPRRHRRSSAQLKAQRRPAEILIFTIFEEEERVLEAVRAGASGYLLKGTPAERIVEAIGEVSRAAA